MKSFFLLIFLVSFELISFGQILPPVIWDLDNGTDSLGWTHYAGTGGVDAWGCGEPVTNAGGNYTSPPNCWKTNLNGTLGPNLEMWLMTPSFNLSNLSTNYVLSFWHKRRAGSSSQSTNKFEVYYTYDDGITYFLYDPVTIDKINWQSSEGFTDYSSTYQSSKVSLASIQGNSNVRFLFKFDSKTSTNTHGWSIDDFVIRPEEFDLIAMQGDPVTGVNKNFSTFEVHTPFNLRNEYNAPLSMVHKFYLSPDPILDSSDIFLGQGTYLPNNNQEFWTNTFNLPAGLSAGTTYYVMCSYDAGFTFNEDNETNNVNYTELVLDSIYEPPYVTDFEGPNMGWNNTDHAEFSEMTLGTPDYVHNQNAHSGSNAWHIHMDSSSHIERGVLESPYMDLRNSVNTHICFWSNSGYESNLYNPTRGIIKLPSYFGGDSLDLTYFTNNSSNYRYYASERQYNWDCHCIDISNHDYNQNFKLLFYSNYADHYAIDDIYVGSPKVDLSIERQLGERFSLSTNPDFDFNYYLWNSGIGNTPVSTTNFYWSNDSILDAGDILIGSKIEPTLSDTIFSLESFTCTKPVNTPGEYFILTLVDADSIVDEMREYNNVNYFKLKIYDPHPLPYHNDFETDAIDWNHTSTWGIDEWQWTSPNGSQFDAAFSGSKAFVTSDTGFVSHYSKMHLFSPVFDLTQLPNPVLEFNLYYKGSIGGGPGQRGANAMYSIDGGCNWELLDTTASNSYKLWYPRRTRNQISGIDQLNMSGLFFGTNSTFGKSLKSFQAEGGYQGKDYDEAHHYVLDLNHLSSSEEFQIMFVYNSMGQNSEGILMDDFEITEHRNDFILTEAKKTMADSEDELVQTEFSVKNNENYTADSTGIHLYLSADSIFNGNEVYYLTKQVRSLKPFEKQFINILETAPANFGSYNYILYDIDPDNLVAESDEVNNKGYIELNMDTNQYFSYPRIQNFEEEVISGWTWHHDSSATYDAFRFMYRLQENQTNNHPTYGQHYFLEPINWSGYHNYWHLYPFFYLESPTYNFSNLDSVRIEFDVAMNSTLEEGGNIQYSLNNGLTWNTVNTTECNEFQNMYSPNPNYFPDALMGDMGWHNFDALDWEHVSFLLDTLAFQENVKFRFKYRGDYWISSPFRLDNFYINPQYVIHIDTNLCQGEVFELGGNQYTSNDTISQNYTSITGVDSTVYYVLTFSSFDISLATNDTAALVNQSNATYQWLDCNNNYAPVAGETNQMFVSHSGGDYACEITFDGCTDTTNCVNFDNLATSPVQDTKEIQVYPNPFIDFIKVEGGIPNESYKILDANGKVVLKGIIGSGSITTKKLNPGIYFIEIEDQKFKIIKYE